MDGPLGGGYSGPSYINDPYNISILLIPLRLCGAYGGPSGVKNRQNFTLGPVKGLFAPPKIILTAF